ncbi:MAG: hypothetical protein KIT17_18255 [Rubrivivax sp.]|nr:hypothetical protein [Rubrivivax sp.]
MSATVHDAFGQPLTCASPEAVRHYDRAVDAHLHAWPGAMQALDEALAAAPGFALAHALAALLWYGQGRADLARQAAERALSEGGPATTQREQAHVRALATLALGRAREALPLVLEHARHHPLDLVPAATALGAYGLFAFSGRADHDRARLDFIEALARHHAAPSPWLQAQRGWARIEAGAVAEGLAMAREALARRPENGHNAHIVVHGLHESGEPQAVLAFLGDWLPRYPEHALLWGHLHWHGGLAEIALGRADAAEQRLRGPVLAYLPKGTPFMGLGDVPSLLWRLALLGRRGLPWDAAETLVRRHFARGANVFGELHIAMVAAARGDTAALADGTVRLQATADAGHEGAPAARHWCEALRAALAGDMPGARAHLAACERDAVRLGGSGAQRGVIEATREALGRGALPVGTA